MSFDGDLYPTAGATSVMTTKGDMVDYDTARQRLGIGSTNQILQVTAGGLPAWQTLSTAGSVLTTQGDVLVEGGAGLARLGQSTNNYTLATKGAGANPTWQASATSILSTTGDLLYASSANTLARLAGGTSGDILTANGAGVAPSYQTPAGGGSWSTLVDIVAGDNADLTVGSIGGSLFSGYEFIHVIGTFSQTSPSNYFNLQFYNGTAQIAGTNYASQGIFGSRILAVMFASESSLASVPIGFCGVSTPVYFDFNFSVQGNGNPALPNRNGVQQSAMNGGHGHQIDMNTSSFAINSASDLCGFIPVAGATGSAVSATAGSVYMKVLGS